MSDANKYLVSSQQRVLRVLLQLPGHEINGLSVADVANALDISQTNAFRDLTNLKAAGLAEQIEDTKRWRLGPKLGQIAVRVLHSIDKARRKADELQNRYTRDPT